MLLNVLLFNERRWLFPLDLDCTNNTIFILSYHRSWRAKCFPPKIRCKKQALLGQQCWKRSIHAQWNLPWLNKNFKDSLLSVLIFAAMALLLLWKHILRLSMIIKSNPTSRSGVQCRTCSEEKKKNNNNIKQTKNDWQSVWKEMMCERCSSHHASWTPAWPSTRRGTRTPPRNSSPNFRLLAFHRSTLNTKHNVQLRHGRSFNFWHWHSLGRLAHLSASLSTSSSSTSNCRFV